MKIKSIFKLSFLAIFVILLSQSCAEDSSFGEDLQVQVLPTDLSYPEILNAREFSYIESAAPFMNSNGHPVYFELVSIKKGEEILDDSYKNSVTILNPSFYIYEHPDTGDQVVFDDLSEAGQIIIEDENPFGNGEYFFTVSASVEINGTMESTIFEDALRLIIGPELVEGISYCPNKLNFVSGETTTSNPAEIFGGNPDFRFELGTESDKLTIDASTGAISLNSSYSISGTEILTPIINIVSNLSDEIVSIEEAFTAVLSTTPIDLGKEVNYFFYPQLKPNFANNPAAGGNGYSVEISDFASKPNWVKKHFYKEIPGAKQLKFQEVLDTRTEAGVSGIKGLTFFYWGPLANPFQTWMVADAVNLSSFAGCFDTKVVFWVKQNIPQAVLDGVWAGETETPVNIEIQISSNYTGDVYTTTDWVQINDLMTCKIGENGDEFLGTPYPLSGEDTDPAKNANNLWVKCELDLADYGDSTSFTIAIKNKTTYDSDLSGNLRGELYISDLHFVASEK